MLEFELSEGFRSCMRPRPEDSVRQLRFQAVAKAARSVHDTMGEACIGSCFKGHVILVILAPSAHSSSGLQEPDYWKSVRNGANRMHRHGMIVIVQITIMCIRHAVRVATFDKPLLGNFVGYQLVNLWVHLYTP